MNMKKPLPLYLTRMPQRKLKFKEQIINFITIKIFGKQSWKGEG